MTRKQASIWLFLILFAVAGAAPSYALCMCNHDALKAAGCCAAPAAETESSCCAGDAPERAHPCETSAQSQDADSGKAVAPMGCTAGVQSAPIAPAPVPEVAPAPAASPEPAPAAPRLERAGHPAPPAAPPGAVRLLTNVYRL